MNGVGPEDAASTILEESLRRGALRGLRVAWAEVFTKSGATRTVTLQADGSVVWGRTAEGGISLRVLLRDGATGFASACGPHPGEVAAAQLVDAALDAARSPASPHDPPDPPAGKGGDGRGLGIFDPRLHTSTPADLEGLLDDGATEALRTDPRVRRLDSASIAASSSEVRLANSAGFHGSYRQTLVHMSLGLVAGDAGGSIVVKRSRPARTLAAFSPALFGDETARLAATEFEGRPPGEGIFPALLGPAASAELLRCFARTLTVPAPRAGAEVGSRCLTIIDDGRLPGGCATAPFDGEGVATRRTPIVSRGAFAETIHDLASASRHPGGASTGNGIRASFRDAPRRMPSNLFIAPGSEEPEELMAELGRLGGGIWIQSVRPPSAVRGDESIFTVLATGRWVAGGKPGAPIAGALVSWPLADLLQGVLGAGNDLTFGFMPGSYGAPSLLVKEIGLRAS
ncbi:MAG TPA: TldD/PmbA family protein [Candidatus Polarisedimenticolia bacterium]|jgi:PmbA protein